MKSILASGDRELSGGIGVRTVFHIPHSAFRIPQFPSHFFAANRSATAAQLTTFHHAFTYSARTFLYFR